MKRFFSLLTVTGLIAVASADKLPTYGKHPWFKTYHGYSYRDMDVQLATDGSIIFYPKEDRERLSDSYVMTTKVVIEYKSKNARKWTRRTISSSGFEIKQEAAIQKDKVSIVGTVTGGVRFKLNLEHDKKGVTISADFVEKPQYDEASYRLSLVSEIEDLYGLTLSSKKSEISAKTRGDGVTIVPKDDDEVKKKKFRLSGKLELEEYSKAGIKSLQLKANRYGRNDFYWALADETSGTLKLDIKNEPAGLHKGFFVSTVLVDENGEKQSKGLRIEQK